MDNNIQIIPNRQNLNNQPLRNERNRFNIERDLNNHDNHGPRTTERMDRERIREILINIDRNRDRFDEWNEGDFSDGWGAVQIERNIDRNRNSERNSSFESSSNILFEHSWDNLENEENQRSEEINESNESELSEFNERRRGRKRLRLIKAKDINKSEESEESENSEESKESLLSEFKKRKGRKRLRLIKNLLIH